MFPGFPKIQTLGTRFTSHIFNGPVEITEKLDGSQIGFRVENGELHARSKRQPLVANERGMFSLAMTELQERQHLMPDSTHVFYGEYLSKPRHNALTYGRVPKGHIALWAVKHGATWMCHDSVAKWARWLDLEAVPLLYEGGTDGMLAGSAELTASLEHTLARTSVLGNVDMEGLVITNRTVGMHSSGEDVPFTCAKYVSTAFKEVMQTPKKDKTQRNWEEYKEQFRTEARWAKALQHLREEGVLEGDMTDIGKLMKEAQSDLLEEEKAVIVDHLWKTFGKELLKSSTRGLPDWYKQQLAETIT